MHPALTKTCLLLLLALPVASATPPFVPPPFTIKQSFTYGKNNKEEGSFSYQIILKSSALDGPQYRANPAEVAMDFDGAEASMFIRFTGVDIDRKHKVVFSKACVGESATAALDLRAFPDEGIVLKKGSVPAEKITYELRKDASGSLFIRFDVLPTEGGAVGTCEKNIEISYNFENVHDPDKIACKQARDAFDADKVRGVAALKAYVNKNDSGACGDEFGAIISDFAAYEAALNAFNRNDFGSARKRCEEYKGRHYTAQIEELKRKLPPLVVERPTNGGGRPTRPDTAPKPVPDDEADWQKIESSACAADFEAFLKKHPDGEHSGEARQRLMALSTSDFTLSVKLNKASVSAPAGTGMWFKDLSLHKRIKEVRAAAGSALQASFEEGEYRLYVRDTCGRDTTFTLTNDFKAELDRDEKGKRFTVRIFGGEAPYSVTLRNVQSGKTTRLLSKYLKGNTAELRRSDLEALHLTGIFEVLVNDKRAQSYKIPNDRIENPGEGFDVLMLIIALLLLVAAGLLCYLLVAWISTKKRKRTIYDVEY